MALHEATLGKPFEDIVEDEFRNVLPLEAQQFLFTVCVPNRLDVPVRSRSVLSRIHGIPFEEFRARFFSPLEHVVVAENDGSAGDLVYRARHSHIAEIVFERILRTEEERFERTMSGAWVRSIRTTQLTGARSGECCGAGRSESCFQTRT
ncbi:MAG: hypothetical protein U0529_08900 [Thermoanaerobaculia bacterium]